MDERISKMNDKTKEEMLEKISKTLVHYREKRGMTLRELAAKADCSAGLVSAIEKQKSFASLNKLYDIADALDIPIETFFSGKPLKFGEFEVDPIIFLDEFKPYFELAKKAYNKELDSLRLKKEVEYLVEKRD